MSSSGFEEIVARPLPEALAAARAAPVALLALGIPLCPSCELLSASLAVVREARPGLHVEVAALAAPEEWALREALLWPLGIHVSRASVPVLALFVDGAVAGTRQGGGPASVIDTWLAATLGPPTHPVVDIADTEVERLADLASLRGRRLAARGSARVELGA